MLWIVSLLGFFFFFFAMIFVRLCFLSTAFPKMQDAKMTIYDILKYNS